MKLSLVNDDIEGALTYFYESSKEDYEEIFNILSNKISTVASGMHEIEFIYAEDHIAKYRIKRPEEIQGQNYDITYYIYFIRNSNGLWRIERF